MKQVSICISFLMMVVLSACNSGKSEAVQLSKDFFGSLADTTNGKPKDFYPQYTNLDVEAKSDAVDVDESEVTVKNDSFTVRCYNSYTDAAGTFKQDSVTLFMAKNNEGKLYIYDSHGLITIDKDLQYFGTATGAFSKKEKVNDVALAKILSGVRAMMYNEYLNMQQTLQEKVKIVNWSWETGYDGGAHGEGRVINNFNYPIEGIKYHVTYYDRRDNFMAEDEGRISKTLYPGERYDFTFWSSNAKYPSTANLKLEFPDKVVVDMIKSKSYKGDEYQKFLTSNRP